MLADTIAAIATPMGESGIGVVRVSGEGALSILDQLFRLSGEKRLGNAWKSHRARYGTVVDPTNGEDLDDVVALVMRGPHSYTGEDVVELSCHGGPLVLQRVLEAVFRAGARPAERGEFSKRAFLNGRLDLTQAEAVIDLIRSRTDDNRRTALGQLHGRLSDEIRDLRSTLLGHLAHIEAVVDFPEEEVDNMDVVALTLGIEGVLARLKQLIATAETGRLLREGLRTAIVGRPNVGKSSLLNVLLREDRAIVTAVPGTTRDVIEEQVNVAGVRVVVSDTAGIRDSADEVERLGVERSRRAIESADLVLLVVDDSTGLTQDDRDIYDELIRLRKDPVVVVNKIDLGQRLVSRESMAAWDMRNAVWLSALTGEGLEQLERLIRDRVYSGAAQTWSDVMVTRTRHKESLARAAESLNRVVSGLQGGVPIDLASIDLKEAWSSLGEITGETVGDDVLEWIFEEFCIGK